MIIAISGRIYAGKDATARTIQYVLSNDNKPFDDTDTTLEEVITAPDDHDWWLSEQSGFDVKKYAAKLKQIASILTGIPQAKFEDRDFKATLLGPEWDHMPVRKFLQLLGTDCVRFNLHENTWVNALFADYTDTSSWIITDCRFPNEYDAVKARGGIVIRVTRGDDDTIDTSKLHASETSLDNHQFDWVISNTGDLGNLAYEVTAFLKHFHMIK